MSMVIKIWKLNLPTLGQVPALPLLAQRTGQHALGTVAHWILVVQQNPPP